MSAKLDHLAVAAATLEAGQAAVEAALGVALRPGGQHARYGTHNALLGLGAGRYLEVIAPDPAAPPPEVPRWFGLDHVGGPPRLANWIVRVEDVEAARAALPVDPGPIVEMARGALRWRITVPEDGSLPLGGGCPTLITWDAGGPPPGETLPVSGVGLVRLVVRHPQGAALAAAFGPVEGVEIGTGDFALKAVFTTPRGEVAL